MMTVNRIAERVKFVLLTTVVVVFYPVSTVVAVKRALNEVTTEKLSGGQ
jgi:hypothetical protein